MSIDPTLLLQLPAPLQIELSENFYRKDYTQSERAAIERGLIAHFRAQTRPGQRTDLHPVTSPQDCVQVATTALRESSTQKVAKLFGVSARTVEKRQAVVAAAEREPEKYADLVKMMDRSGNPNGAYHRLKVMEGAEQIRREPPALPGQGPYRVIVADPPWSYSEGDDPQQGATHYPRMSIEDICAMPVARIAHDDAVLWLWITNHHLLEASRVISAWGFQYKTTLTWAKDRPGQGMWLQGQTEHCLLAVRGRPHFVMQSGSTLLQAPVGRHSRKPDAFYALVEKTCPAPRYAELFSRYERPKWDGHGNEIKPSADDVAAA